MTGENTRESDGIHRIYTDGSGDGRMAWFNETTGEHWSGSEHGITSNEAEYTAVHVALEAAKTKDIEILSDSKLVVNQLNREWHIKDDRMRELFDKVQALIRERGLKVKFTWVPREENPAGKYLG
jgi:ribonuclease HI